MSHHSVDIAKYCSIGNLQEFTNYLKKVKGLMSNYISVHVIITIDCYSKILMLISFLVLSVWIFFSFVQKQPSKGVPRKRCSENMQQIYRRTPMPNCDFNKVAKQLYWNHTSTWVFLRIPLDGCFCLLKENISL